MFPSADQAIEQVHAGLATLAEVDLGELDAVQVGDLVQAAHALQNRMAAQVTRIVGSFDAHGDPGQALTTAAWVAWKCKINKPEAKASVSRARALKHMPIAADAYAAGEISSDHVRLLAAAHRANRSAFADAEAELVDDAKSFRFDRFADRVAYFRQATDPDGTEECAQDAYEMRHLHGSRSFENTVRVDGVLDPIGGTIWKNELDRLERALFESDWAEARKRLGEAATANDLRRTPGQRRADAQVIMAVRSAMQRPGKDATVLLTLHVDYETFAGRICQLADGTVVTPGQVATLLGGGLDVDIERVVFDGPSRIVDVGAKQRLFRGATRRAVEVRDLECDVEPCDVPYERCEVDHIVRWERRGSTIQSNGRLRCPAHHEGRRRPRAAPDPPLDDEERYEPAKIDPAA